MINYSETPTYVAHTNKLTSEEAELLKELQVLASAVRGTPGVAAKRNKIKQRLKTIKKNLLHGLSNLNWSMLFDVWIETRSGKEGGLWTPEQLALIDPEKTTYYEGITEKALKHRLGLSLQPSQNGIDIQDGVHDGDDKYLGSNVSPFRTGKLGKRLFIKCLRVLSDDQITDEMLDGEVGPGKLFNSLPEPIKIKLQNELQPKAGLACYPSLYLSNNRGFVRVMASDYAQAFSLVTVTQYSPKYRLKREYVEAQLLASQDGANKAA